MTENSRYRLLYAWDMGANWGHIGRFTALLPLLQSAGFDCSAAIPEIRSHGERLASYGIPVYSSPRSEPKAGEPRLQPLSHAHILSNRGYASFPDLSGMVIAWRSLISLISPDVILIDTAPAALIAAESLCVPTLLLTVPFFIPPHTGVLPDFIPGSSTAVQREKLSGQILETINSVRKRFALAPIEDFAAIYATTDRTVPTFRELDPNAGRAAYPDYSGPIWDMGTGMRFNWPAAPSDRKVFVYMRNESSEKVLEALRNLGWATAAYCPDLPAPRRRDFESESLHILDSPADMRQVMTEATLLVNYGSHATVAGTLWHGIPQLIIPYDAEKAIMADCVTRLGAGLRASRPTADGITASLLKLDGVPGYRDAAAAFAVKHRHFSQDTLLASMRDSCLKLAGMRKALLLQS